MSSESMFPKETIDLPSNGILYPENSPLRSGKIDIYYMTAKHEDILTSTNLIQKGVVIDKLMEALIATPGVNPDDLLLGDLNAVMVAARILAYGRDYPVQFPCNSCGKRFDYTIDLSTLETVSPEAGNAGGEFTVQLPTGVTVTFKLLTRKDEKNIQAELDGLKKLNSAVEGDSTTRLKYTITSVNGNRDQKVIREFSESIIIRDVRALREEIKRVTPDVNFNLNVTCSACDAQFKARMPFGANFFWPDLRV